MTTSSRRPTPASRATRRSRRPASRRASFLERNRNRLLWIGAGGVFVVLAALAFLNSTQPAYACLNQFTPTPGPSLVAPTAQPGQSGPAVTPPPPGFVQQDMGKQHIPLGSRVNYTNCPPASGKHYQSPGGPIDGGLHGPDEATVPQGWIHNLEHGAIVLLYSCPEGNGPGCDDAGQAALGALLAKWPASPVCQIPAGNLTPVIARFDDMPYPYAALVWDVVLPMQALDENLIFEFYRTQGDRFNPEPQCAAPTSTPGLAPTAGPTGTVAPSGTPAASPAASATDSPS